MERYITNEQLLEGVRYMGVKAYTAHCYNRITVNKEALNDVIVSAALCVQRAD